jgi:hypothetical protein
VSRAREKKRVGSQGNRNEGEPVLSNANEEQLHEGKQIKRLLEQHGLTIARLAEACGVEWSSAQKYINAQQLGVVAWDTCSKGLCALAIDPALVKRVGSVPAAKPEPIEDLKPHLPEFSRQQLETLLKILRADARAREKLIDAIEGVMLYSQKR